MLVKGCAMGIYFSGISSFVANRGSMDVFGCVN
jgi:hypothetical protein